MDQDGRLKDRIRLFSDRIAHWRERVNNLSPQLVGKPEVQSAMVFEELRTAEEELRTAEEELRTAEEELRQQNEELIATQILLHDERERYRDLFDSAPDGYFVTDDRGNIQEANRAASRLLGISAEFLRGKPLLRFFHPEDVRIARHEMAKVHQTRTSQWTARVAPRAVPSFLASVSISARRVGTTGGIRPVLLWLFRDASDRAKAEMHSRALAAEIEELRARLNPGTEEYRSQAADERERRTAAEEANRSKDQLLALISHELRNPLTPVLLAIEQLLAADKLDPIDCREKLDMMRRNLLMERRLIDDLLDVTRIMHGKMVLHRERLFLHALLDEVLAGLRDSLAAKGQVLHVDYAAGTPAINADALRMRQVFWNLLNNAIKFTPEGGRIFVGTRIDKAERRVTIEIRDTGIGISADSLPSIFNPFEQTQSRFARAQGGLGLGLSIVRSLVHAHRGEIQAMSDGVSKGATFLVKLPLADHASASPQPPRSRADVPRSLSVCLVDDHADTRNALSQLLKHLGHEVVTAGTIQEALAQLKWNRFDLLISDLNLPDGSGCDLLRQAPPSHVGRAISFSGDQAPEQLAQARAAGFAAHLLKPISIEELQTLLSFPIGV